MSTPARALALLISDLHLQESHPRTADAFFRFLDVQAAQADQLYLLGDIFEYWAGDDDLRDRYGFSATDAEALARVTRGIEAAIVAAAIRG